MGREEAPGVFATPGIFLRMLRETRSVSAFISSPFSAMEPPEIQFVPPHTPQGGETFTDELYEQQKTWAANSVSLADQIDTYRARSHENNGGTGNPDIEWSVLKNNIRHASETGLINGIQADILCLRLGPEPIIGSLPPIISHTRHKARTTLHSSRFP